MLDEAEVLLGSMLEAGFSCLFFSSFIWCALLACIEDNWSVKFFPEADSIEANIV